MDTDEMLSRMIAQASHARPFEDWADVLTRYAACLKDVEAKLDDKELASLLTVGSDFYRTLARAEAYRNNPPSAN